ncbi:OLC1v1034063C2 [Oldenlandia corymbosa var. corymbosa]|uniref:OLC1v1034063C2 n=1 Tax=Oldenlandia corymbosa var. corymbosa TaxID=529605 RepID=A0AAV1CPK9_OLDCO|nr:OLC1v1034063C2 [Oldenlandia corymbosa var. corymbosa]
MATYYHGNPEIQGGGGGSGGDGLHTLILMNHAGYVGYSDNQQPPQQQQQPPPPGNFVFLNSNTPGAGGGGSAHSLNFTHAPPPSHTQQFVGIPLNASATTTSVAEQQQDIAALHGFFPRVQYNLYSPTAVDLGAARDISHAPQGLSLSLSSQQSGFGSFRLERDAPSQAQVNAISPTSGGGGGAGADDVRVSGGSSSSASGISNGVNGMQSVILSSKYLKAAQELLDEVVSVGKGVKNGSGSAKNGNNNDGQANEAGESSDVAAGAATGDGQNGSRDNNSKRGSELSTAERQEIQMKKAKLVNMLDEVEQRYRQYHHQMQIVISWFEQAAGIGSAKTYTALALQTISKQFRCLKDAILGQIRAASKSLGEEDNLGAKIEGSRLKFVDNQLRQQRALQQLGMIQHNAWRPQRGLPERSVSVLRAWLFEHFLHPYPKDSDKLMLAKQTGLTRSQVSNWFINARVRLWKPMVEEMYMEEIKENEKNGSEDKMSKSEQNEDSGSKSNPLEDKTSILENQNNKGFITKQDHFTNQNISASPVSVSPSTSPTGLNIHNQPAFNLIGSPEMDSMTQGSPKKLRGGVEMLHSPNSVPSLSMDAKHNDSNNDHLPIKFGAERQSRDGFSLLGAPTNFIGGFGTYPIADIGRFSAEQFPGPYSGNGVSLTLGLPHCENLSISGAHQSFLPNQNIQLGRGVEIGEADEYGSLNTPTSSHSTSVYETINIQNRKRFAAQLLPDFVT